MSINVDIKNNLKEKRKRIKKKFKLELPTNFSYSSSSTEILGSSVYLRTLLKTRALILGRTYT